MIEGYAYALVINGQEIQPWSTGEDGALRQVNLDRYIGRFEQRTGSQVRVAHIIDQRIDRVMVRYPAPVTIFN